MADDETATVNGTENQWPLRVPLGKPITVREKGTDKVIESWAVLEFREPKPADIIATGMPVIVVDHQTGRCTFDPSAMTQMMARLSKVAPPYLAAMDTNDWVNCATMLQPFFLPDWGRLVPLS